MKDAEGKKYEDTVMEGRDNVNNSKDYNSDGINVNKNNLEAN